MTQHENRNQSRGDMSTLTWYNYMLGEGVLDALGILDTELNILHLSQRWQDLLGQDPKDTLTKSFNKFIHPPDRKKAEDELKQCLTDNASLDTEIRLKHTDGSFRWVHLRAVPLLERNLLFVSVHNLTPLKKKIGHIDSFFTLSPDLFCVVDFEGYFIRVNPAWQKLLGWSQKQLLKRQFRSFIHPDDRDHTEAQYANCIMGADTALFENRYRTVNGTYRWVEWKSVTSMEEQLIFAIARDITGRKLFEHKQKDIEIAKVTSQAKTAFLAAMTHELKTPLNGIVGSANLAYEESENPDQKELLETLKTSAESLTKIVNDIIDYAAMDAGEIELDPRPFSLQSIITEVERMHLEQARMKGIKVISSIDKDLPDIVMSDPTRLAQVLRNLVDNALRFTKKGKVNIIVVPSSKVNDHAIGGIVTKKSDERHLWTRISVIDTGMGISINEQKKIFDVFHQTHEFIKRKQGGVGIGLTISKHLVELLGGHMGVTSILGKGSTFYFDIPFRINDSINRVKPAEKKYNAPIPQLHILVVEDNVVNQKVLIRYLSKQGHSVTIAENGYLAIEAFETKLFDLVLMDLQMPEMDGLTATRYIRDLEAEAIIKTPIVAVTAHATGSDEEACYEAGMDDFIVKPFTPKKLNAVLRTATIKRNQAL